VQLPACRLGTAGTTACWQVRATASAPAASRSLHQHSPCRCECVLCCGRLPVSQTDVGQRESGEAAKAFRALHRAVMHGFGAACVHGQGMGYSMTGAVKWAC
jgi:hypothetical protein